MDSMLTDFKSDKIQVIKHTNSEPECSTQIFSPEVVIQCRNGVHNHGSSKVKLINRIDYNWELKYYMGQLVAAHTVKDIIAYAMKGKDGGMVRVINQVTSQRALIKNLVTDVRDVTFAFIKTEIILGCVDEAGNVFIYEIFDKPDEITYKLLLHISSTYDGSPPSNFKLVWCPYLPAPDEDPEAADDAAKTFVFLNGCKAEVWDVTLAIAKYGSGPLRMNDNQECSVQVDHEMELIDASYSSDGTAIATACVNGYVYFYQIYMVANTKQKLLHEWKPHDGKPLSCLIFIDNILDYNSDSRFWKFAITGANHNQEIKLWSCENWLCLQTIHFKADPACIIPSVFLKIRIDYSGQHVLMCDINNKVLYVLKLERNDVEKLVAVTMISEFLLPAPFLSYHILEASIRKIPILGSEDDDNYSDDQDEFDEDNNVLATVIKMLVIQPKKFQECDITFQPESILSNNSDTVNEVCDKQEEIVENIPKLDDLQPSVTLLIQQQTNKSQLMTPEAFTTSSRQNSRPNSERNSIEGNNSVDMSQISLKNLNENTVEDLIDFGRPQKDNFASGGSSPSREVQEILSLNNSSYSTQECFNNMTKPEDEEPQKPYSQSDNIYKEKSTSDMVWPKIPVVKDNEIVKEDNQKFATEMEDSSGSSDLSIINYRLTSLENAVRKQTLYIEQIRNEIKAAIGTKSDNNEAISRDEFSKELEVALSRQQVQIAQFLEKLLAIQKNDDREKQELFITTVSQTLAKTMTERMEAVLAQELKNAIGPPVRSMLESLKHQIDVQYSQKLKTTEILLKDSIANLVNSKAVTESLGMSVVSVIAPSLEKCYRDMITTSLIPSWEKVCNNMFQQINATFTQGTKEYTASVESYMDRQRKVQERGKDLIVQMQAVSETMKLNSDKLSHILTTEINKQFTIAFKSMQDKVLLGMKDVIAEQVRQGFKSQASVIEDSVINAVRSRAVTPSPHLMDSQTQLSIIQAHLAKGNYSEAFQTALQAENLSLVTYVCEKVDCQQFFDDDSPLPQNCLLALIQQLSVDLSKQTDLKISYIRAAFLALSTDHPNTRQFMPKILKELQKKLQIFMASNPSVKHLTEARLLKMAVDSMLMK